METQSVSPFYNGVFVEEIKFVYNHVVWNGLSHYLNRFLEKYEISV